MLNERKHYKGYFYQQKDYLLLFYHHGYAIQIKTVYTFTNPNWKFNIMSIMLPKLSNR